MSKLLKILAIAGILTGTGLVADAYIQKDGKMDEKDKIEYVGGLTLLGVSLYGLSKSGSKKTLTR